MRGYEGRGGSWGDFFLEPLKTYICIVVGGVSCLDFTSRLRYHARFIDETFSNVKYASLNYST